MTTPVPAVEESERRTAFVLSIDALLKDLEVELTRLKRENATRQWLSTLPPRR